MGAMFAHLRLHSEFSVVDSTCRIDDVVKMAAKDGQPALAITDLNNLFGGVKFYKEGRGKGVKPILGAEINLEGLGGDLGALSRVILLVQSHQGYLNICELLARAWTQNVVKGVAVIKVFFHPGAKIEAATAQITDASQTQVRSLPPGATLVRHRDPYAGSLRYHLGLVTPNDPECFIEVDGQRYHWKDGESVMFDETFIHHAANKTSHQRVVLFCDVERPLWSAPMRWFNRLFSRHVMAAASSQNVEGEGVGVLNQLFSGFYKFRLKAKQLKEHNSRLYYLLKWVAILGVLWWLFW